MLQNPLKAPWNLTSEIKNYLELVILSPTE